MSLFKVSVKSKLLELENEIAFFSTGFRASGKSGNKLYLSGEKSSSDDWSGKV